MRTLYIQRDTAVHWAGHHGKKSQGRSLSFSVPGSASQSREGEGEGTQLPASAVSTLLLWFTYQPRSVEEGVEEGEAQACLQLRGQEFLTTCQVPATSAVDRDQNPSQLLETVAYSEIIGN